MQCLRIDYRYFQTQLIPEVLKMVALLFILTVAVFVMFDYFVRRRGGGPAVAGQETVRSDDSERAPVVAARYRIPDGVLFSPNHAWAVLEESGTVRVGIDDFARSILGGVDRVVSRSAGEHVKKGDEIFTLRHDGRSVPVRSPIDGVVERVNAEYAGRRSPAPSDPLSNEWLCQIRPRDASSLFAGLRIGAAARDWFDRETQRLRVLLATIRPDDQLLGQTLQDGGEPVWGLSEYLSDDEWEQIRTKLLR